MIDRIRLYRFDRIVEKHEGPWDWSDVLDLYNPEFVDVEGRAVLFPVDRRHHRHMSVLRVVESADGDVLTVFLFDTTYEDDPKLFKFFAGRMAVCERFEGEDFFLTTAYHEWYVVDSPVRGTKRGNLPRVSGRGR
ncbi:MAG TPA: hypothetical protein VH475_28610 [Tepidisphaeraceae bacterium]